MSKPLIVVDPAICHGQACIAGTRIPVSQVLAMLANGDSEQVLLEEFSGLTLEKIRAAVAYGSPGR